MHYKKMVKIQREVDGYRGRGGEVDPQKLDVHSYDQSRECSRQASASAISVPDWCLVLL